MTFNSIRSRAAAFLRDETGLAAVEYAVMAVVLVGVIVAVVQGPLNDALEGAFQAVTDAIAAV
jgi:Flp pilus assembly pilin Flp